MYVCASGVCVCVRMSAFVGLIDLSIVRLFVGLLGCLVGRSVGRGVEGSGIYRDSELATRFLVLDPERKTLQYYATEVRASVDMCFVVLLLTSASRCVRTMPDPRWVGDTKIPSVFVACRRTTIVLLAGPHVRTLSQSQYMRVRACVRACMPCVCVRTRGWRATLQRNDSPGYRGRKFGWPSPTQAWCLPAIPLR